jgi:hypothetical protein
MSIGDKVPKGYRSKNLEDRRGEFKRKETTPAFRDTAAYRMQENMDKMDLTALKRVMTERNIKNLEYGKGKRKH